MGVTTALKLLVFYIFYGLLLKFSLMVYMMRFDCYVSVLGTFLHVFSPDYVDHTLHYKPGLWLFFFFFLAVGQRFFSQDENKCISGWRKRDFFRAKPNPPSPTLHVVKLHMYPREACFIKRAKKVLHS